MMKAREACIPTESEEESRVASHQAAQFLRDLASCASVRIADNPLGLMADSVGTATSSFYEDSLAVPIQVRSNCSRHQPRELTVHPILS
jgi:hypothetical protein